MSTMSKTTEDNISLSYYDNFWQIERRGTPLTNIYWSRAKNVEQSYGTVYLIHGYGGSPIEPCMKIPMQAALDAGFDVAAIEGVAMSATYGTKRIEKMNLARQKAAIMQGLEFCETLPNINHSYNIAWAHSISCRALSDLLVAYPETRNYFRELVLNNPYFITPSRVSATYNRIMAKDPSGITWQTILKRPALLFREIENIRYQIPSCLFNLNVPLPKSWAIEPDQLPELSKRISSYIDEINVLFVLGTSDNMAEYSQNVQIFNGIEVPNRELISIRDANHSFENKLPEYTNVVSNILERIKVNQKFAR